MIPREFIVSSSSGVYLSQFLQPLVTLSALPQNPSLLHIDPLLGLVVVVVVFVVVVVVVVSLVPIL